MATDQALKNLEEVFKTLDVKARPDWDEYFMLQAELIASRSTCYGRKVGAVIVKDKRIIATGYNGAAGGLNSCFERGSCYRKDVMNEFTVDTNEFSWLSDDSKDDGLSLRQAIKELPDDKNRKAILEKLAKDSSQRYCKAYHAEENALSQAATQGISVVGADLYVTLDPCERCVRAIISHKIDTVYSGRQYDDSGKFDAMLKRVVTESKAESKTSFKFLSIDEKTRALLAYEILNGDVSRSR